MSLFELGIRTPLAAFDLEVELASDERTLGVFGPSGAGKTTLLEVVAGWRDGAAGHVRVAGRSLLDTARGIDVPARERGIGYVPQDVLLFPHWTTRENVFATNGSRPHPGAAIDAERVLDVLELGELLDRRTSDLSGGERHRVAIARALVSRPSVLLLDEPLASLDRRLRRRVLGDLVRVRDAFGVPMLVISHDPTELQVLCDGVVRLERGRVAESGAPEAVLAASGRADFENVLFGTVGDVREHSARVVLDTGLELVAPRKNLAGGDRVVLGLRADDVLVALEAPVGLSARNLVRGRIQSLTETPGPIVVAVECDAGPRPLRVNLTEDACRELQLESGKDVVLVVKTHSLEVLASFAS